MRDHVRPALFVASALLLGACAAPTPESSAPAAGARAGQTFTAAPGDIMVLSDRCVGDVCDHAAAATLPGVTELVYIGMRGPNEAVFQRRQVPDYAGPTVATAVPGVMVPARPEVEADPNAGFVPPRDPSEVPPNATELVVDPIAGAQFGVEDMAVNVTTIAPGRVIYSVERL